MPFVSINPATGEPDTAMGPVARSDLRDALHDQVERSVAAGARLVTGGTVPDRPGAWYPPTVLPETGPGMAAYEEELFGPVAVIVPARDEADAIRIANDTVFGLGDSIYTADDERGERIAAEPRTVDTAASSARSDSSSSRTRRPSG